MPFKNIFMNCVKKLLDEGETKGEIGAFKKVEASIKALLLLILDSLAKP